MANQSPFQATCRILVVLGVMLLAGCGSETSKSAPAGGWGLDTGQNVEPETDLGEDDLSIIARPPDAGTMDPDMTRIDATTPEDLGAPPPDEGMEPTLGPGDACDRNNECVDDLVCCPSRTGPSCTDDCWGGGICEDETDCASDEGCCEFGGGNKFCSDRCAENNGNNMSGCETNSSCQDSEVCCFSFGGGNECRGGDNCDGWYGGVCEDNSDCRGGQECCRTMWGSGCGDECP